MNGTWHATETNGTGRDRKVQREALRHLQMAGYLVKDGKLVDSSGKQLTFEILTLNQGQEKIALAYQRSLAVLGIGCTVRTVDDTQYQSRTQTFDYDMIIKSYPASLSPGTEQIWRWSSQSRDVEGSYNFAGTADPSIDAMIEALLAAREEDDFVAAVRAFDRVLISGFYVVPLYYLPGQRVAYSKHLEHPAYTPIYGYQMPTWWVRNVPVSDGRTSE